MLKVVRARAGGPEAQTCVEGEDVLCAELDGVEEQRPEAEVVEVTGRFHKRGYVVAREEIDDVAENIPVKGRQGR